MEHYETNRLNVFHAFHLDGEIVIFRSQGTHRIECIATKFKRPKRLEYCILFVAPKHRFNDAEGHFAV